MSARRRVLSALFDGNLPARSAKVAAALNVRACRQYKSSLSLLEDAQAENAAVIVRSMFETVLAMEFVLRERFTPFEFDKTGKRTRLTVDAGVRLTRDVRSAMYLGYASMQQQRIGSRHKRRPGMKRIAAKMLRAIDPRIMKDVEHEIGPKWRQKLEKAPTYSGLSIANLARSLGRPFANWYHLVYPFQSDHVHASDPSEYIDLGADGEISERWRSHPRKIIGTLETSIAMLSATMSTFDRHVDMGVAIRTAIDGFHNRYQELLDDSACE